MESDAGQDRVEQRRVKLRIGFGRIQEKKDRVQKDSREEGSGSEGFQIRVTFLF